MIETPFEKTVRVGWGGFAFHIISSLPDVDSIFHLSALQRFGVLKTEFKVRKVWTHYCQLKRYLRSEYLPAQMTVCVLVECRNSSLGKQFFENLTLQSFISTRPSFNNTSIFIEK